MNISLDLYKTFYIVAKYNNMTKAAQELMISQPAVSKAIKTLEDQLGGTLFNRSKRGIVLNEEGKMLFNRIKPAMDLIRNAENEFDEFKKLNTGEIKIGISSVLTKCLLIDTLSLFRLKYPDIKISIINGINSDLSDKLKKGLIDFAILSDCENEKDVKIEKLTSLEYCFFYNPLFFEINIKNEDDINKYPLILQQKTSNTRKMFDKYSSNKHNPYMEVVSQDLICQLAYSGIGIGFALKRIVDLNYKELNKVDFCFVPDANIYIVKNISIKPSFAAKIFIKELKKQVIT